MAEKTIDERIFDAIRRARPLTVETARLTLPEFKDMVRDQYFMLLIDAEAALEAIPRLLPPVEELRRKTFDTIRYILSAPGEITGGRAERLKEVAALFGLGPEPAARPKVAALRAPAGSARRMAS